MNSNDLSAYNEIFFKSSKKHIEEIMEILESLKTVTLTPQLIDDLYIHLHSLKGECNIMGHNQIGNLCEDALIYLKEEKLRPTNSFNVINNVGDSINLINNAIQQLGGTSNPNSTQST